MKSSKSFTIQARLKSFVYAFAGIKYFFRYEAQAILHLIAGLFVIFAGFYFHISSHEWLAISFAIAIVIITEMLNTAIEKLTDMVSPEINPKAKVVKDLAAGAVLVASVVAAIVGLLIFIPRLM